MTSGRPRSTTVRVNRSNLTRTFNTYDEMNESEKQAFKQGCRAVENKVKGNLGFLKPKENQ